MSPRDPDGKRRQLLDAALTEFAAHGIAGARIDRIAQRAGCSAGLVYTHFGSKDELFSAVFDRIVADTLTTTPITPDDLPEYAGRLFDRFEQHPEVARLATWYRLERGDSTERIPAITAANKAKTKTLRAAQKAGTLTDRFTAEQLLVLILSLSAMWTAQTSEILDLAVAGASRAQRRKAVVLAVERIVAP